MKQNTENLIKKIGPVLRAAMAEVIQIIRKEAATFVATKKAHLDGKSEDFLTNADLAGQKHYEAIFLREFPGFGMLGEENGLNTPCTIHGEDIRIVFDPLDGTKAFIRRQSHGVGTMVAVVRNGVIIAAYVGDVNTGEIYGFAPDQPTPTRVQFGVETELDPEGTTPLEERYVMIDMAPHKFHPLIQKMVGTPEEGGLFKEFDIMKGSFGLRMARLWKGEIAAVVFDGWICTPWDEIPPLGISKALGFVFIKVDPKTGEFEVFEPEPKKEVVTVPYDTIVVHKDYAEIVLEWLAANLEVEAVAA